MFVIMMGEDEKKFGRQSNAGDEQIFYLLVIDDRRLYLLYLYYIHYQQSMYPVHLFLLTNIL